MTATIALPRQPHSDWLTRLRTIMVLRPGQRVAHVPGIGVSTSRRAVSSGAAAWWLAGGAPAPVAVWQPIGAASLAASYLRIAGSAGHANIDPAVVGGVAPTFDPATGWTWSDGAPYLLTGVVPTSLEWSILARFSNVSGDNRYIMASSNAAVVNGLALNQGNYDQRTWWRGSTIYRNGAKASSGVQALAGIAAYMDGALIANLADAGAVPDRQFVIGAYAPTGTGDLVGNILAIAIWNTSTDHATWMPAVMAAAAAL